MIVDGYRDDSFFAISCPNDVLIEEILYFGRFQKVDSIERDILFCAEFLVS